MEEKYEWITAEVDCGTVTFRYRVEGRDLDGSDQHDEDVSDWTEDQIIALGCDLLDCHEQRDLIKVEYC